MHLWPNGCFFQEVFLGFVSGRGCSTRVRVALGSSVLK